MQATKFICNSPLVTNYAYSCNIFNINSIYAQSLRWKRKPIWLPTAKTKVFRVTQRPVLPVEEVNEIKRLYNNYRTAYRSVRKYMLGIIRQTEVQLDQEIINKAEQEDYDRCMKLNEEWNKNIAIGREIRLQKKIEASKLQALEKIEMKKLMEEENIQLTMEKVEKVKLLAPTFITRDNIDQAIEEALSNVVNYNKALEPSGEWYTKLPGETIEKKPENIQIKQ